MNKEIEVLTHNRMSWNNQSQEGSPWCAPVEKTVIEDAKKGNWNLQLTPVVIVPRDWFGEIKDKDVLCLASGGGQQAPVLSAAGANVVSFDLSDGQLEKDRMVARRDSLSLTTVQGDMADLSAFEDGSFDLIFNPVSNVFAQDVRAVWRECSRVLRTGGTLLSGFMNPFYFLFDHDVADEEKIIEVKYRLPYTDLTHLDDERKKERIEQKDSFEYGHSLNDQLGGQIEAGFAITGLYEDGWGDDAPHFNEFAPTFIVTRATKM